MSVCVSVCVSHLACVSVYVSHLACMSVSVCVYVCMCLPSSLCVCVSHLASLTPLLYYQMCIVAIGMVSDLCRAITSSISIHMDSIMVIFLEILSVSHVASLSSFGVNPNCWQIPANNSIEK